MLLTAAVAGFLAWANLFYQRSRPYQRTPVPDQIGNQGEIRDICFRLGHQFSSYSAGGGGSGGMHSTTRTYDCRLDLPKELRGRFMEEYKDHIRALLDKHAGSVSGGGTTRDDEGLRDFEFDYAKGSTSGTVIIRSLSSDTELSLLIFVHEYDDKR